ncbi:MAG: hypothetical protein E1N59_2637 [Puniceicoccaceae bacterium 5H]|nr:MAG: hypothetical protein E1N59_2637 [Puniceicoccaceae bacterium 5H]
MRILFLGDIVGKPGREAVKSILPGLRAQYGADIVIANGENSAAGAGINAQIARDLHEHGVDGITLGDHCWDQRGFENDIGGLDYVCRPGNLPKICPGREHLIVEKDGFRFGVFTVLGSQFMKISSDNGFAYADQKLLELREQCDAVMVEIHAEATSEKIAMGWFLDGRVALVVGTHTHVPTADYRVLPRGTAYISDAGMSGPYESVLGREIPPVIARFVDGMPRRFGIAEGDVRICGCIVDIDRKSGLATKIDRLEIAASTMSLLQD